MKRPIAFAVTAAGFILCSSTAGAQLKSAADSLYETVAALDSAFFEAYNRCEIDKVKSFFTADLEFYHDQTGLSHLPSVMNDLRKYVCGKVHRDLVPNTFEVNVLKGYGAVSSGIHMFCDSRKYRKCEDASSGVAKFVNLWRFRDGKWLMSRVISYDHVSSHQRSPTAQ
jgi:hypothetical protein